MIGRLFFVIFFCLGGFLFYIPKWILMGTKGSRDRKKILNQYHQQQSWHEGQPMWPPPKKPS